jgi:hypothetical protein
LVDARARAPLRTRFDLHSLLIMKKHSWHWAAVILLLAPAVLLGAGAAGPMSQPQAIAKLKIASKDRMKAFKSGLEVSRTSLESALAEFDTKVAASAVDLAAVSDLFAGIQTFQTSILLLFNTATNGIANDAALILFELGDGTSLQGNFPDDFYCGDGGAYDLFYRDINKNLDALYAKVRKRLAKTVDFVEKSTGDRFLIFIDAPRRTRAIAVLQGVVGLFLLEEPSLDFTLTTKTIGGESNGYLWIGGLSSQPGALVEVTASDGAASKSASNTAEGNGRFGVFLSGTPGHEIFRGNYLVKATENGNTVGPQTTIGLR